jgi:ribosomal protein S27AE
MNEMIFVEWYLSLPLPAQIAVVAGGIAIAALAIILAIYIIKWTLIAVVKILKGIGKAIKWIWKKITGQSTAPCCQPGAAQEKYPITQKTPGGTPVSPVKSVIDAENAPRFCPHCGTPVAANIRNILGSGQSAFCPQCGTSLILEEIHIRASVQA